MRWLAVLLSLAGLLLLAAAEEPREYEAPAVSSFALCDSDRALVMTTGSALLYWEIGPGKPRTIATGDLSGFACDPTGDKIAVAIAAGDREELRLYSSAGKLLHTFPIGASGWSFPQWSQDGKFVVYEADPPKGEGFGPESFSGFGVLDVQAMQAKRYALPKPDAYRLAVSRDNTIYVSWDEGRLGSMKKLAKFDTSGKLLGYRRARDVIFSAHEKYCAAVPFEGGTGAASIAGTQDGKTIAQFDLGKHPVAGVTWNPVEDDLALLELREGPCCDPKIVYEVYNVAAGRVLKTFRYPGKGWVDAAWTRDGKSVVVYHDRKFVVEPLEP